MKFDFTGKVVLASGAASGMGLLSCKRFVEMGGCAVMSDINEETLNKAVAEVNGIREDSAIGVVCDVRKYEDICKVRDAAVERFGRVDLLIPFAGGAELRMLNISERDFVKVPIEVYDWSIDVNLRSQLYFDHAVLPVMKEQGSGVIIHIGSVSGAEPSNSNIGYATAKCGAMYGLTRSIAYYGAPYGIRCNSVAPGPVLTREAMSKMKTALGRAADPDEIVNYILYLASPEASFITGECTLIDGGRSIMLNKQ